ncbi:hypothetical protein PENTCL1PPCAC_14046 [Pristionchus entomophagus]|uniref:Nuclear receptor n=1 Tax=Pristionchus entomophagus TaxID=358040 RepID=A0AAV5T8G3_9BILA|nr:hypothetical protein PENTCL1PPCAC_14046 [Pristionchus entomophagus]
MECLICTKSINQSRLGINCCRACASFYNRASDRFDDLKCKDGEEKCREQNPKSTCRKCRLKRFREVLTLAEDSSPSNENVQEPIADDDNVVADSFASNVKLAIVKPSSFIDHTSYYNCEPSNSVTPLLDLIRKGYSFMCKIRRSGEFALKCGRRGEGEVAVDNLILTRVTYASIYQITLLTKEAIIEFADHTFEDFRSLPDSIKDDIISEGNFFLDLLESTYRACHHFPDDKGIRLSGYTVYIRDTEIEKLFEDCPDKIDKQNLVREVGKTMKQFSRCVRQYFESTKPTDVEFLALFGLALWKEEVMSHNESLLKIASRIRLEILNELHAYYRMRGTDDYASRVGNIFCLLSSSYNCSMATVEDFQVMRLMNMFDNVYRSR